jgi:hypothetical protein
MSRKSVFLAGCLLVLAVLGPRVFAHNLITAETAPSSWGSAIRIDDPSVSRVYYSRLDPRRPQTWFRFDGKAGDRVDLSVGVPKLKRLQGFSPFSALVGPGLPGFDLGFEAPPGLGAEVISSNGGPREFHEGVTGTDSWIVMEQTVTLPGTGTYYFVAFPSDTADADGSGGRSWDKLWMAIGTKERFGLKDIFALGSIKRFVREFHEVR